MSAFDADAKGILTKAGEGFVEENLHQTQLKQPSFCNEETETVE